MIFKCFKLDNIPTNAIKPNVLQQNNNWLYKLNTNLEGFVYFYCLPPNEYNLNALWSNSNIKLNFDLPNNGKIDFKSAKV